MILSKDSTSNKVFAIWKGPAEIIEIKSPHSYMVELNGASYHVHANKLKKFNVRVHEVLCESIFVNLLNRIDMSKLIAIVMT